MGELNRFIRTCLKGAAVLLLILSPLLVFNVVLDPYGVFFHLAGRNRMEPNKRYMKMKYILGHPRKFNSFIFGSSRVNSIDPARIPNGDYYNMTYSNGVPRDHLRDIRLMLRKGVSVRNLLIGIDYFSLLENPKIQENDLLRRPYPVSLKEQLNCYLDYIFFRPGQTVIERTLTKKDIDLSRLYSAGIVAEPAAEEFAVNYPEKQVNQRVFMTPYSAYIASPDVVTPVTEIDSLVRFAGKHRINIIVFIHPTQISTFLNINLDAYYDALERLARVTDFYDFSGVNSVATDNRYFQETSHYFAGVGDMIIERIYGQMTPCFPDDFGLLITSRNVEEHINNQKRLLADYLTGTNPVCAYAAPAGLPVLTRPESRPELHLDRINGISVACDPGIIRISSPLVTMDGSVATGPEARPGKVCVRVGDRLFETQYETSEDALKEKGTTGGRRRLAWHAQIPSQFIGQEPREVSLVGAGTANGAYTETEPLARLKRILKVREIDPDSLEPLDRDAVIMVDYINGRRTHPDDFPYEQEAFINMKGWAVDKVSGLPSGGVIVCLDGKSYLSQFIYQRPDLAGRLKPGADPDAGWGIVLPADSLGEGLHELTFRVLNSECTGYYPSDLKYNFTCNRK